MSDVEFVAFRKIPRLKRDIVVTEKIDGTNAQIYVGEDGLVLAGSRNRWLTLEHDNHGFCKWVKENEETLRNGLGPGRHYGEWWGPGIQRRYNIEEKRFSLFGNRARWGGVAPALCHFVPVLYEGPWSQEAIDVALDRLWVNGSVAAPGFMKPEGVVVFHAASGQNFKVLLENDDKHKGEST